MEFESLDFDLGVNFESLGIDVNQLTTALSCPQEGYIEDTTPTNSDEQGIQLTHNIHFTDNDTDEENEEHHDKNEDDDENVTNKQHLQRIRNDMNMHRTEVEILNQRNEIGIPVDSYHNTNDNCIPAISVTVENVDRGIPEITFTVDEVFNRETEDDVKMRIENKLIWLRTELENMRKQDEFLLRQLLGIHDTIMQMAYHRSLPRKRIKSGGKPITKSESMRVPPNYGRLGVPIFPNKKLSEPERIYREEEEENEEEEDSFYIYEDSMTSLDSLDSVDLHSEREREDTLSPLPRYAKVKRSISFNDKDQKIKHSTLMPKYEVSYDELKKRGKIWREVQKERAEKGRVDERKLAALRLIL